MKLKPNTYFNNEKVNRYGFLGTEFDKPKTKQRILFIGDSFGVGVVDYKNNFIKMFEDSLGYEVINLSQPGNSPKDYYEILVNYFDKTSSDMTFIMIFSGNDITEIYYPENNYSINNLKSVNLIKNFLSFLQLKNVSGDLSEENFINIENRRSKILIENSYDKEWRFFEKNIESITRFFKERKKKVYFLIIPDQFAVDKTLQKDLMENASVQFKEWDFADRKIERILKKYDLKFFSLVDTFKICYEKGEELYRKNNTHINEKGNYVVFKYLKEKIKEEK
jgi:lysophospholipase L1-like esterase